LDPENVVLYSNRSAAYLANSDKSKALYDAQKCIQLNADYVKGYTRSAAALRYVRTHTWIVEERNNCAKDIQAK